MNARGWSCERSFTPLPDFEGELRKHGLPLYSLETFTPLGEFDVLGFSLQYEICYTNVLTMLDLGGVPLHAEDRGPDDTLVIAGGPGAQNPELIAPYIDLFVIGDGEPSLPVVCDLWKEMQGDPSLSREDKLARIAAAVEWAYVPRFYDFDLQRRRHDRRHRADPRRRPGGDQAVHDHVLDDDPAADWRRSSRSSRRRTTGSPSRSCAAAPGSAGSARAPSSSGRSAIGRSRRSSTPRWSRTATRATTRSACSRCRRATTRTSRSSSRG